MSPPTSPPWIRATAALGLATAAFLVPSSAPLSAQAHYWSEHFGNESVLLNGAVIGSVTDAGAVFYNPARLLHQEERVVVASAKAYEWTQTRVDDGLGEGEDLARSGFRSIPSFVVGTFTIPGLDGHQFAYGVLTRFRAHLAFSFRDERESVLPILPGSDDFVGFADFDTEFRDDWFGLSWAHALTEDLSLGASLFWFERDLTRRASFDFRGLSETGEAATLESSRSYIAKDKGLVGKASLAWRRGGASLGLNVTLPYWTISSRGEVEYDDFYVGIPDSTGVVDNQLRSLRQGGLPMDWRTPWAVGFGAGWESGDWHFHTATEYYAAVAPHVLMEVRSGDEDEGIGQPIDYAVVEERNAVLNVGAGVRWQASDRVEAFASVATNFSAAPDSVVDFLAFEPVVSNTTNETDFVLVGGGVSARTKWADFTLGVSWQGGRDDVVRAVTLPDDDSTGDDPDDSGPPDATVRWNQVRFLAGFSIPRVNELIGDVVGGGG